MLPRIGVGVVTGVGDATGVGEAVGVGDATGDGDGAGVGEASCTGICNGAGAVDVLAATTGADFSLVATALGKGAGGGGTC
jgi:hypothetical protein